MTKPSSLLYLPIQHSAARCTSLKLPKRVLASGLDGPFGFSRAASERELVADDVAASAVDDHGQVGQPSTPALMSVTSIAHRRSLRAALLAPARTRVPGVTRCWRTVRFVATRPLLTVFLFALTTTVKARAKGTR